MVALVGGGGCGGDGGGGGGVRSACLQHMCAVHVCSCVVGCCVCRVSRGKGQADREDMADGDRQRGCHFHRRMHHHGHGAVSHIGRQTLQPGPRRRFGGEGEQACQWRALGGR